MKRKRIYDSRSVVKHFRLKTEKWGSTSTD